LRTLRKVPGAGLGPFRQLAILLDIRQRKRKRMAVGRLVVPARDHFREFSGSLLLWFDAPAFLGFLFQEAWAPARRRGKEGKTVKGNQFPAHRRPMLVLRFSGPCLKR